MWWKLAKPRVRRVRRWAVAGAGAIIALAAGGVLIAASLVRAAPDWWRSVDPTNARTIERAEALENAVVTQLYRQRESGGVDLEASPPWRVAIAAPDANAWLNVRLRGWLASQHGLPTWPESIHDLQVDFDQGLVRVGAKVREASREHVVSAEIRPSVDARGAVWTPAELVLWGRLPVPGAWALDQATSPASGLVPAELRGTPEAEALLGALRGSISLGQDAVITLGDGRQVRLLEVEAKAGRLELTCRTERAPGSVSRR